MNSSDTHEERIAIALADLRSLSPKVADWRIVPASMAPSESPTLAEMFEIMEETLKWCAQGVPATVR